MRITIDASITIRQWIRQIIVAILAANIWCANAIAVDAEATLDYTLEVEGARIINSAPLTWLPEQKLLLLPFQVIALELGDEFEYDAATETLWVERSADRALFSLRFKDGLVTANRRPVGYVPGIAFAHKEQLLLPKIAVETLTGTHVEKDDDARMVRVSLDKRLKPLLDFELTLNGETLPFTQPAPRAVGHVLLIPLRPIAEELGASVEVDHTTQTVTVIRSQDNARFELDLLSGLVTANGLTAGMAPDMNYADPDRLLLPKAAVETLTGTRIDLLEGTNTIQIDLDRRLQEIVQPGADILEQARKAPFTAESLGFTLANNSVNEFKFRTHYREFNSELSYHIGNPTESGASLTPTWLQWKIDALHGYGLSLGDYSITRRELEGVSRVRGGMFYKPLEQGTAVMVLGQPYTGSRESDGDANRPDFAGWALGARFYPKGKDWEIGISALEGEDGERRVLGNLWRRWHNEESHLGLARYNLDLDLGHSDQSAQDLGMNLRWNASYRPQNRTSLGYRIAYSGFDISRADNESITNNDTINGSAYFNYRWLSGISIGARYGANYDGLLQNGDKPGELFSSYGLSLSSPAYNWFPGLQASYTMQEAKDGVSHQYNLGAHQDIQGFRLYTRYSRTESVRENTEQITANLSTPTWSWSRPFSNGVLTATPNLSLNFQDGTMHSHLGMNAAYTSKPLFNDKFRWRAHYGRAYGFTRDDKDRQTERQFLSAEAEYAFSPTLKLKASYRTSFDDGGEFFLVLRGSLDFNPPRAHKATLAGRGILEGRVYLDRNRDEIKQDEEPGLPGVGIRLKGTRLGLRTNRHGKFTILNLPARTYDLTLLQDTLPFGLLPAQEQLPKLLVEEGKATQLDIPIIASGQLRGRVYIDQNQNGSADPEEAGLEGVQLLLEGTVEDATYTASFGQFAFERLVPGRYTLRLNPAFLPPNVPPPPPTTLELTTQSLMQKIEIRVMPK